MGGGHEAWYSELHMVRAVGWTEKPLRDGRLRRCPGCSVLPTFSMGTCWSAQTSMEDLVLFE